MQEPGLYRAAIRHLKSRIPPWLLPECIPSWIGSLTVCQLPCQPCGLRDVEFVCLCDKVWQHALIVGPFFFGCAAHTVCIDDGGAIASL
jgi:hypothetical protein